MAVCLLNGISDFDDALSDEILSAPFCLVLFGLFLLGDPLSLLDEFLLPLFFGPLLRLFLGLDSLLFLLALAFFLLFLPSDFLLFLLDPLFLLLLQP